MKIICLLLAAFTLQVSCKSDLRELKSKYETELRMLLEPMLTEAEELKKEIEATKSKHSAYIQQGVDIGQCSQLVVTLQHGAELVQNATWDAVGVSNNISATLWHMLTCPNLNPFKAMDCLIDDVNSVKQQLISCRPLIQEYRVQFEKVSSLLKQQFLICIGNMTPLPTTASVTTVPTSPPTSPTTTQPPTTTSPQPRTTLKSAKKTCIWKFCF